MFKDYDELRNLQETADLLAHAEDWPEIFDEAQLAKNEVPVYSAIYIEDICVHFDLSRMGTISEQVLLIPDRFSTRKTFFGGKRILATLELSHCSNCCLHGGY